MANPDAGITHITTREQAIAYIKRHDALARKLHGLSRTKLARLYRASRPGLIYSQPEKWSHDELVNCLVNGVFPPETASLARQIIYATRDQGNTTDGR